jgi:hypothetical protein
MNLCFSSRVVKAAKKLALLALTAVLPAIASAQVFNNLYHGIAYETPQAIRYTTDGGAITAGYIQWTWGWAPLLVKTNASGVVQWSKSFQSTTWNYPAVPADQIFAVREITSGQPGYILVGASNQYSTDPSQAGVNVLVIRTDINGNLLWRSLYGGLHSDMGFNVEVLNDGFIVTGIMDSDNSSGVEKGSKLFLMKLNTTGAVTWCTKVLGTTQSDPYTPEHQAGFAVQQLSDGSFMAVGATNYLFNWGRSLYAVRTRNDGVLLWANAYVGPSSVQWDVAKGLRQTADGNVVVSGMITSGTGNTYSNVVAMKIQPTSGNVLWSKRYASVDQNGNETYYDSGRELRLLNDGSLAIVGTSTYTESIWEASPSPFVMKLSNNGNFLWSKRYPSHTVGYSATWTVPILTDNSMGTSMDLVPAGRQTEFLVASDPLIPGGFFVVKANSGGSSYCDGGHPMNTYDIEFSRTGWGEDSYDCIATSPAAYSVEYSLDSTGCGSLGKAGSGSLPDNRVGNIVSLSPNPAEAGAVASLSFALEADASVSIHVTDLIGKEFFSAQSPFGTGSHTIYLPTQNLAPGVYVVRMAVGDKQSTQMLTVIK